MGADEIKAEFRLHDFEEREKELRDWVDARSWTTGDGPKVIFVDAVRWLREHDVLLPGVTTLAPVLTFYDDEAYRREIKAQANLSEGRHDLGRVVFHGHKGEIYQRYHVGMEEQLGALGLVLNCIVLWNTFYMNEALCQLRAEGYPVREGDVERLSPFIRKHLGVHGRYSFVLPDLGGGIRALRDPDAEDHDFGE